MVQCCCTGDESMLIWRPSCEYGSKTHNRHSVNAFDPLQYKADKTALFEMGQLLSRHNTLLPWPAGADCIADMFKIHSNKVAHQQCRLLLLGVLCIAIQQCAVNLPELFL